MTTTKTSRAKSTEQSNAEKPEKPEKPERKAVLSVTTLAPERPFVLIDDERHDLRMTQDFGAIEHQEFSRHTAEYDELWAEAITKREDRKRYEWLLDWLFDHVLVDPKRLREQLASDDPTTGEPRLTGAIKREIVLSFTNAPLLMTVMAQIQDREPENSSTSAS